MKWVGPDGFRRLGTAATEDFYQSSKVSTYGQAAHFYQ
jgi:hypothetical protein